MLEIFALIFLTKKIGQTALAKGLKPGYWKLYTVLAWIAFEFAGLIAGIILFGYNKENILGLFGFGLVCAFGGYLLVKSILDKRPPGLPGDTPD